MKHLIVLSGPIGVGKSSFFEALETFGAERISTRSYILDTTGCENERRALQDAGDRLDRETDGGWVEYKRVRFISKKLICIHGQRNRIGKGTIITDGDYSSRT